MYALCTDTEYSLLCGGCYWKAGKLAHSKGKGLGVSCFCFL